MTLEDAVIALEDERQDHHSMPTDRTGQALQLGIEALMRVTAGRPAPPSLAFLPLKSETD
ncbi:hypothetical protein ES705_26609 [subsurface metagenome]